jgi:hypothetical protein
MAQQEAPAVVPDLQDNRVVQRQLLQRKETKAVVSLQLRLRAAAAALGLLVQMVEVAVVRLAVMAALAPTHLMELIMQVAALVPEIMLEQEELAAAVIVGGITEEPLHLAALI